MRQSLICAKRNDMFKNPKVLSCLDLVCDVCLEDLLSTISSNSSSYKKRCAIFVPLRAKELISDVYTVCLIEVSSDKANLKCQNCCTDIYMPQSTPFAQCVNSSYVRHARKHTGTLLKLKSISYL